MNLGSGKESSVFLNAKGYLSALDAQLSICYDVLMLNPQYLDKFNEKKKLAVLNKFALNLFGFNTYAGFLTKETLDNPSLIATTLCFSS